MFEFTNHLLINNHIKYFKLSLRDFFPVSMQSSTRKAIKLHSKYCSTDILISFTSLSGLWRRNQPDNEKYESTHSSRIACKLRVGLQNQQDN